MNYQISHNMMKWMLSDMPAEKKAIFDKACTRNMILTSTYGLGDAIITVYKEGWYLQMTGTRCSFSIWAYDNDGELIFARKPKADKLHKLYSDNLIMCKYSEADFYRWASIA